jgi:hypothetical protein
MKRIFLFLIITLLFIVFSVLITGIYKKIKYYTDAEKQISVLPIFSLPELNGTSFSTSEIDAGPVLIVRFHPECEHCRYELKEILNSKLVEKQNKVLLISNSSKENVSAFLSQFDINGRENIIPLLDTAFLLSDIFRKDVIPSNYIYDKELKLVKALYGEYKTETILKYLESSE